MLRALLKISIIRNLLCISIIFTCSALYAQFAGGNGTEADPYLVQTAAQLNQIRNYNNCWFKQVADIDLDVIPYNQLSGWQPIGEPMSNFCLKYNGCGLTISNLYINSIWSWKGLFGELSNSVLDSIRLDNVNVNGEAYIGGLVGSAVSTLIMHCHSSGVVTGNEYTGGIVGNSESGSVISYCSSDATVNCFIVSGGLIGCLTSSSVNNCCSWGQVNGELFSGGLAGEIDNCSITDCFTYGETQGVLEIGGLVGDAHQSNLTNCYARGHVIDIGGGADMGGLVGSNSGSNIMHCYWDVQTTNQSSSQGGLGLTTADLTWPYAANAYEDWDFTNTWAQDPDMEFNFGYPYLQNLWFINQIPLPIFNIAEGTYNNAIQVSINITFPNLQPSIYYTLNGDIPTEQSFLYSGPVTIDSTLSFKAKAFKDHYLPSNIAVCNYNFQVSPLVFDPLPQYLPVSTLITISTETVGASIYYSLDGSDPTEQSLVYIEPILADSLTIIKARAYKRGYRPSEIYYADFMHHDEDIYDFSQQYLTFTCSAYPNPFQQTIYIKFYLPCTQHINAEIYNQKGQLVKRLSNRLCEKGDHSVLWNGKSDSGHQVTGGLYILRISNEKKVIVKKLILLR